MVLSGVVIIKMKHETRITITVSYLKLKCVWLSYKSYKLTFKQKTLFKQTITEECSAIRK